jgi:hypothetical protein
MPWLGKKGRREDIFMPARAKVRTLRPGSRLWRPKLLLQYAQALLDLVKAFDRIPQWLLVQEAAELGYPLKILRLSIAVYKLVRVVRIGGVVSKTILAWRGITAGSIFATTEMRVILIRVMDAATKMFPRVNPVLFVDDLAAEMMGPPKHIVQQLGGFIHKIADFIKDTGQELSQTKSLCTASCKQLGRSFVQNGRKPVSRSSLPIV